ncbi:MAG: AraC family transcriptional regulator [Clostridia bacterium]|nr:AraC family transcriptional regulator [Clostridia bacterium]
MNMIERNPSYICVEKDIEVSHCKKELSFINNIPHLHSGYEVYYNISGAKGFMLNGEFFRCGHRDLIIIPRVQAHKVLVRKNVEYERCIINFTESVLDLVGVLCPVQTDLSFITDPTKKDRAVNLTEEQHEEYMALISAYKEAEKDEDGLTGLSVFVNILSFLQKRFENPKRTVYIDTEEINYCDRVMQQIERSFKTASVSEITDRIFVNGDYANRLFKEETGLTIKQYLTLRKIAESKKYLYSGKSVKEACFLSGFRDYANFIRTFKKYEGFSPGELDELAKPM